MPAGSGSRCSPGTGPTSAPRPPPSRPPRTSSATAPSHPPDLSRRSSTDLWTAWTRQADLHERHQRLVDERDALQHVAAIHARYTPDRDRLSGDEVNARRSWLDARQQVADLDAALKSETADLQTRIWGAWHQELAQARRAAEVVRDGAGRLGQHRRQVREASNELTAFAQRWHPALPDLPTSPAELAEQVMWLHGRRVDDPINAYIARTVADAHPDADRIRDAERHAYTAYNRAEQARTQLDEIIYAELRPYGRAAHVRDPADRLTDVTAELADVERDLRTASVTRPGRRERTEHPHAPERRTRQRTRPVGRRPPCPTASRTPATRASAGDSSRRRHGGSNRPHRAGALPTTGGASAAEAARTDQRPQAMSDPRPQVVAFHVMDNRTAAQLGGRR